jgi:hypothetical protein
MPRCWRPLPAQAGAGRVRAARRRSLGEKSLRPFLRAGNLSRLSRSRGTRSVHLEKFGSNEAGQPVADMPLSARSGQSGTVVASLLMGESPVLKDGVPLVITPAAEQVLQVVVRPGQVLHVVAVEQPWLVPTISKTPPPSLPISSNALKMCQSWPRRV